MKNKYQIGQRLSYFVRNEIVINGERISGKWTHHVGFVKQIRRHLFHIDYVMIVAKSDEIHIVPQRDIIGPVESRKITNKSDITNE